MQNYNDILNGVTDGTKDLTINALTCNGAVSFKGAVTLGDASADDITITGSLASSIPIKTTNAFDIGSATLGLRAVYFGANSQTAKIVGNTGMAGAVVATLPVATDTLVGLATTDTLTNKTLTSPKLNEAVAVTTTATKLNYLTSAGGTTGTASTNIVFSTSPSLTTPTLGVATATSITWSDTTKGIIGTSTNDSAAATYVGERLTKSSSLTPVTTAYVSSTALALTAGEWCVSVKLTAEGNAAASMTGVLVGISTDSTATTFSDIADANQMESALTGQARGGVAFSDFQVLLTGSTNYYIKAKSFGANSSSSWNALMVARRVR